MIKESKKKHYNVTFYRTYYISALDEQEAVDKAAELFEDDLPYLTSSQDDFADMAEEISNEEFKKIMGLE